MGTYKGGTRVSARDDKKLHRRGRPMCLPMINQLNNMNLCQ